MKKIEKIYTSGAVPYTNRGLIAIQIRGKKNKKNGEEFAFFGGHRKTINGKLETAEQAMLRETYEEFLIKFEIYESIGKVKKKQENRICFQETYMIPVETFEGLVDHEGLGLKVVSVDEARDLHMNPEDNLVLDQIEQFFKDKDILY